VLIIGQIFTFIRTVRGELLNSSLWNLASKETRNITHSYVVQIAFQISWTI